MVCYAHATGEPGLCYIDHVNEDNPTPALGSINATNPCGEQPLLGFEACNLGSLNVSKFVLPDESDLDWDAGRHALMRNTSRWPFDRTLTTPFPRLSICRLTLLR
ncbi:MAG: hypothetical protein JSW47_14145 [Phycisphaerales bacterium]|nr:MAG: hypothetical protein JSW47_14145 [Phycisphaerales bacterium]